MILMQELNLAYKYGTIYWKTACLTVNSGLIGEREGNTDYGAVAKAIGDMRGIVLNPDINRSQLGFTPLEKENKILFGLKPIAGLGKDALQVILEKRPFKSFEDFVQRAVIGTGEKDDKTISEKKGVILIKAGCFDNLDPRPRRELMIEYTKMVTPKKDKLTITNLPYIIDEVPEHLKKEVQIYKYRNMLFGRNKVSMTPEIERFFMENYAKDVEYTFKDGKLVVDQKSFDKVYKKQIEPLRQWVISPEAADIFNKKKMREFWKENCMGTVEQWEMETIVFYSNKHELDYVPLHKYFDIVNFFDLKPDNIVEWKQWGKRKFPRYELAIIAGTVVDKNKDKHIVYLSTQYGVVPVKYQKGAFLHYDKKVVDVKNGEKVVLDPSWFNRGSRLVIIGYRRGEEFVPKVYKDTAYEHTTMLIESYTKNDVKLRMEKIQI